MARAANFAGAVASHAAAGMPSAAPWLKSSRLAVCDGCDQRTGGGSCAGCGCTLETKASWAGQDCPLGRWPAAALPAEAERLLSAAGVRPYESLDWLRRWALAGPDPLADVIRYTSPPPDPGPQTLPIYGWIHVGILGCWEPIARELFSRVERSGLLAATGRVFVGVVGPPADLSWFPPWAEVVRTDGPLELGEDSTLEALWAWSKGAPDSKVWYLHTKGASHPAEAPNITAWRDYLSYFTVLRWRECSAALEGPYDCCGCDWTARDDEWFIRIGSWVGPSFRRGYGFEGNFWWATSRHLAALPPGEVTLDRTRWDAEWSFVGAGRPRARELHGPHVNLYTTFYPRSRYDGGTNP